MNGAFEKATQTLDNVSPGTGEVYGTIPRLGSEKWTAPWLRQHAFPYVVVDVSGERAACLNRLADAVRTTPTCWPRPRRRTMKTCHWPPMWTSRGRKTYAFTPRIQHYASESHAMEGEAIHHLTKPLAWWRASVLGIRSVLVTESGAPLAAGNCVVYKPSELTPVTAYLLSTWIKESGFPDGVFNVLHGLGPEVGEAMVTHPDIAAVSSRWHATTRMASHVAPSSKS